MVDNSGIPEGLRKALARNRMLQDVLNDESAAAHDALLRERCLREMRRVATERRWWRRAAAAAVAAMVMASIGGAWLLADHPLTPGKVETANEKNLPSDPLLPHLVSDIAVPVPEMVRTEAQKSLLQIISTSSIQTYVETSSSLQTYVATSSTEPLSNKLVGSFSVASTANLAKNLSFSVETNTLLKKKCLEESTEKTVVQIATINDVELLSLPKVIGIVGFAGNRRLLLK